VYVVIDVPEPGPNPVVKLGALGRIQRLVAEAQAHADRSGIPDSEIDAAVEEAMAHVRRRG